MLKRFESANRNGSLLSQWEKGFIESLTEQFNKRGRLSPKQIEIFERIETQKLSKTAQEASQKWAASYEILPHSRILYCSGNEHRRGCVFCAFREGMEENVPKQVRLESCRSLRRCS